MGRCWASTRGGRGELNHEEVEGDDISEDLKNEICTNTACYLLLVIIIYTCSHISYIRKKAASYIKIVKQIYILYPALLLIKITINTMARVLFEGVVVKIKRIWSFGYYKFKIFTLQN